LPPGHGCETDKVRPNRRFLSASSPSLSSPPCSCSRAVSRWRGAESPWSVSQCRWVFGLVETYLAATGKPDLDDRAPSGFLHVRTRHPFLRQRRNLGLQVATHEIEVVAIILFRGMNRDFGRRQREDQPPVAGVDGRESKDVPEEGAISRRILTVDNCVRTKDHDRVPILSKTTRANPVRARRAG